MAELIQMMFFQVGLSCYTMLPQQQHSYFMHAIMASSTSVSRRTRLNFKYSEDEGWPSRQQELSKCWLGWQADGVTVRDKKVCKFNAATLPEVPFHGRIWTTIYYNVADVSN